MTSILMMSENRSSLKRSRCESFEEDDTSFAPQYKWRVQEKHIAAVDPLRKTAVESTTINKLFSAGRQYWKDPDSFARFSYPEQSSLPSTNSSKQTNIQKYFSSSSSNIQRDKQSNLNVFHIPNPSSNMKSDVKQATLDGYGGIKNTSNTMEICEKVASCSACISVQSRNWRGVASQCHYCESLKCANCLSSCHRCGYLYCSVCCINTFDSQENETVCLSCLG